MAVDALWMTRGTLLTPSRVFGGALCIARGRIAAIRARPPRGAKTIDAHDCYVAPGFVDLHIWGKPDVLSRELVRSGTTAFLTTLGPEPEAQFARDIARRATMFQTDGAQCLGFHLEGPFVNPARGGALPKRWMRAPTASALNQLWRASDERIRLMTIAPELPGARAAIAWCRKHRVTASLGHSDADAAIATQAIGAGATAVTHVFNGMRPFHHRQPSLVDVALTDSRLTAMAILDGVHISPSAFRLLVKVKGIERVALVTDAIRHAGWDVVKRGGAWYRRDGTLAGSALTMMQAVRNAVTMGGVTLSEAVRMATEVPARLLGDRARGALALGRRADLVIFDRQFHVQMTIVNGRIVYQRG